MGKIDYEKLWALMKDRSLTTYRIRKESIIGERTLQNIREGKGISMESLAALCKALDCQPGDILEYVD
jgi:putative transcriptional regulator